jgi:hypothetical protein
MYLNLEFSWKMRENHLLKKLESWREMEHADDPFETMCFYISKGYLEL